jgi:hypothetical protein
MAVTYIDTMATNRDKIRFYIQDTVVDSGPKPGGDNFSDNEIAGLLTAEGKWERAVAAAFETLAGLWGQYVDITVGPRREAMSQTAARYAQLAKDWRKRHGSTAGAGVRYVTRTDGYSQDVAADTT